jgi:hypothetical protein
MEHNLANPPKYFRTPISRGGESRVERDGGHYSAGLIRGVSVITRGEALGHDLWIDDIALQQVEQAINSHSLGIKSRFTHPGMCGDGLGKHVGRIMHADVEGAQVFADQHFNKSSHKTPDGDLAGYLMDLADEDPLSYGLSISFEQDAAATDAFQTMHLNANGEFQSPDPNNLRNLPHVRIASLHAADAVDEPAANPNGLFHRERDVAAEADAMASYALGLTSKQPETIQLGLDPDRVRGFVSRYLSNNKLEIVRMAENTAEVTEAATTDAATEAAPAGIQVGDRVTVKSGSEHDESHAGLVGTVGMIGTLAMGIRFDSAPDVPYKWYTEDELDRATEGNVPTEEPAESPEVEASQPSTDKRVEVNRFRAAFGDKGAIWYAEGLTFEQGQKREVEELRNEVGELKKKLASRTTDGEQEPVSFNTTETTRNGFASKIRVK